MKRATLTLTILITLLMSVTAQTIKRQKVIDNAKEYANLSWRMNTRNAQNQCYSPIWIRTYFPSGATTTGMAYCWGCGDKIPDFMNAIAGNGKAGNICTEKQGNTLGFRSNTFGVDCSGLVTRALGRSEKHLGTGQLEPYFTEITDRRSSMRMGDIFNKKDDHTAIFSYESSSGNPVVFEASATDWKVSERVNHPWSYFNNYKALRYKDLQDGGLAKVNQGISVTPSTVRRGQSVTVIFHLKELAGASIQYDTVTVAVLDQSNRFKFDLEWKANFSIPANGEKSYMVASARMDLPPGTYKLVARGRVTDWFDFQTTNGGVNGKTFTVTN